MIAKEVVKGQPPRKKQAIFVLKLLWLIVPVHFHRFHRKNIKGFETKATGEPPLVHQEPVLPKEDVHFTSNLTES